MDPEGIVDPKISGNCKGADFTIGATLMLLSRGAPAVSVTGFTVVVLSRGLVAGHIRPIAPIKTMAIPMKTNSVVRDRISTGGAMC